MVVASARAPEGGITRPRSGPAGKLLVKVWPARRRPLNGLYVMRLDEGSTVIFRTAEEARAHVLATKISGDRFELAISSDFTFAGQPDTTGFGMCFVVDAILAQEYIVDGFEQRDGYRLYRYKPFALFRPPHNQTSQRTEAASKRSWFQRLFTRGSGR